MDANQAFWGHFRDHEPDHEVYTTRCDHLHLALPICIHGDEGGWGLVSQDAKRTLSALFAR